MDRQRDRKYKEEKDENIYSELVFQDDLIQGSNDSTDIGNHSAKNTINTKTEKERRMQVLEVLPLNYVICIPKNSRTDAEGIIACTLVPREMLTDMVSFDRSKKEQIKNEEVYEKQINCNHTETELLADIQVHAHDQSEDITNADNESKENSSLERDKSNLKHVECSKIETRHTHPIHDYIDYNDVENTKVTNIC